MPGREPNTSRNRASRANVALLSYRGRLDIGVHADPVDDPDLLLESLEESFRAVQKLGGQGGDRPRRPARTLV